MTLGVENVRAHLEPCDKANRITWKNSVHNGTETVASGHLFVTESKPHSYIMTRQPCGWLSNLKRFTLPLQTVCSDNHIHQDCLLIYVGDRNIVCTLLRPTESCHEEVWLLLVQSRVHTNGICERKPKWCVRAYQCMCCPLPLGNLLGRQQPVVTIHQCSLGYDPI